MPFAIALVLVIGVAAIAESNNKTTTDITKQAIDNGCAVNAHTKVTFPNGISHESSYTIIPPQMQQPQQLIGYVDPNMMNMIPNNTNNNNQV